MKLCAIGTFNALLLIVANVAHAALDSGVYDIVKERYHGVTFLEIGYFFLDSTSWVYSTATFTNFTDPLIFLSLPEIPGETYRDGYPAIPRLRNVQREVIGSEYSITSFEAKIFLVNDSFCSKTWYTPVPISPPLPIVWMVIERGAWELDSDAFFANSAQIYRLDNTYEEYNFPKLFNVAYPNGVITGFSDATDVGAVTQLQTLLYDRFMLIRGRTIFRNAVRLLLVPHDSATASYYRLINPNETVAYILFKSGYTITCKEKLTLESRRYPLQINEVKRSISFQNTFLRPPGVFGMIQSMLGRDSVGLRVFDRTNTSSSFITQEDQCLDEDNSHTTLETVAVVIVGQVAFQSQLLCNVVFDNPRPTSFPTFAPTAKPSSPPTAVPTNKPTASPTAVPSSAPTAKPTGVPSSVPTATPSSSPSASPTVGPSPVPSSKPSAAPSVSPTATPSRSPTNRPTAQPSRAPTLVPTARPTTKRPTATPTLAPANHSDVVLFMRGNFETLWNGPKFFAASASNASLFVGEPDVVENPKVRSFVPSEGGLYVFTAGFEETPEVEVDERDLLCRVYWSVSIHNITSNQTVTFEGTYNSTLALSYDYTIALWTVQFKENLLAGGYFPCVPSSPPTVKPTAVPTAVPTARPTSSPTASPTPRPTAVPTRSPTAVPTASPTLAPTKVNNTNVDLYLLASNGNTWGGVELYIQSSNEFTYYRRAPNASVGNPLRGNFLPMTSGIYVVSAILPPSTASVHSDNDLRCMVYWEFYASRNDQLYLGTYNTTYVFQYEFFKDQWTLLYSENVLRRYTPCLPSAQPTRRPTRNPTLAPTARPSVKPSMRPTARPTSVPTLSPTALPTASPTFNPTRAPTRHPTDRPTLDPTLSPTPRPTFTPTRFPTRQPTLDPTLFPTMDPTLRPTHFPTSEPSLAPTYNASSVIITMAVAHVRDWSGVEMIVTGPESSHVFRNSGPRHGPSSIDVDFFPDSTGNYTFEARYEPWIPDNANEHSLKCQIYFMLNFTNGFYDLVVHGTYKTKVVFFYDWHSDEWDLISERGTTQGYQPCVPSSRPTVSPTMFNGNGGTYDMIANRYVIQPWMEIGYTVLDTKRWVSITGSFTNFYDPVVFLSVPNINGETSNDGFAVAARINNVQVTRTSTYYSEVTWESKLFLTNDSYCSKQWYTPRHIDPPIPISWMIVERGAWNLSSRFFFVDKGPITRRDDSYFLYNMIPRENPYECDSFDSPCQFPSYINVDNIGAITQIQTLVYNRFLLVRAYALNRRQGLYLLTPHDSADPAYYVMMSAETMAFMHFQGGVSITCRESVTIETSLHRVTHFKEVIRYRHNFTIPPGVFGMISSVVGQDSVGLRAFDRTNNGAAFITQEDKCFDQETNHTSEELVSIFVAGAVVESSDFKCDIIHDYNRPSTFRDNGGTFDMIRKRYIDDIWMEIGYTALDAVRWVRIETTFKNFTDPVVFLSLPDIAGETSNDGFPAIGRLQNVELSRFSVDNSTTSFEAKLFLANDSFCSSQWYTPVAIWPPIPISWMVAERGAWNLSSNFFFVDRTNIWREDRSYEDYNFVAASNPTGCVSDFVSCQFPEHITVDRLGAVTQLQTLVYDRFLLVRGFSINRRNGRYLLTPHDAVDDVYYKLWESEVMGFMHYHDNVRLNCKEDLTIETEIYKEAVTNIKIFLPYRTEFKRPPGVFGQIMTTIGRDSVGLRAFNRSTTGSYFITQEDQCFDEETDHTTPETVSLFIAGTLPNFGLVQTNFTCNMRFTENKFVSNGGTFDLIEDEYASQPWMEFGYTALDNQNYVHISSSFLNFYDPVVFLSLPDIPGETSNLGYPAVGRVKNVVVERFSRSHSQVTFDAKIFLANSSACSSQWYTPQHISTPISISWIIAERGSWNLTDNFFYVNKGSITREDHTYELYNMKRLFNLPGCNRINPDEPCAFPNYVDVGNIGMIAQLQTIVYDRFLLVRGFRLTRKAGLYLLTPHDSIDLTYYVMLNEETLGYMHFSSGASIECREKITIETSLHFVTHEKQVVQYEHNFTVPPGVFGLVSSVLGQDSVGLRSFSRSRGGAAFITQEDQCVDEETKHTSLELVSILVTGSVSETSQTKCDFVLWSPPTNAPTRAPSSIPSVMPNTAAPSSKPNTRRPTLISEFRTPYPSTLPEFVTNIPTNLNKLHTELPTTTAQWGTSTPTRVGQFHSTGPTKTDQFLTNAPTLNVQFHTEAPTTIAQFSTSLPTLASNFVTEGPTASTQFRTNRPSTVSALYTHAPTSPAQFHTSVPTRSAQFHTETPNYKGSARPSVPSAFVTAAPTRLAQFNSPAPTRVSQFVTMSPTRLQQFRTEQPTRVNNFYSFIPTRTVQFQTRVPTLVVQHSTSIPTLTSQFSSMIPTAPSMFLTRGPTNVAEFSTAQPTLSLQFSTSSPSTTAKFLTQNPTTTAQFYTNGPTSASQFQTPRPTLVLEFSTSIPTRAAQFRTACPTALMTQSVTSQPSTASQFHSEAPTSGIQFITQSPTLVEQFHTSIPTSRDQLTSRGPTRLNQFLTSCPTSSSNFVTSIPTRSSQFNTNQPTLSAQLSTQPPSPTSQFASAIPTPSIQFSSNLPTQPAVFHTEAPSRIAQFATRSPTTVDQYVSRLPTTVAQFSTSAPTTTAQFHTNIPTLASQHRVDDFVSAAPTNVAQFLTAVPTQASKFHTRAPSTVLQWRTSSPSRGEEFVTNYPTIAAQFVTESPTLSRQFHTNIPSRTAQFRTNLPTTVSQFLTTHPTSTDAFVTNRPSLVSEFNTNIPTKDYQYHTELPTKTEQFPPHLRPVGQPTLRPTGATSTAVQFEAYSDLYNAPDCQYWLSSEGIRVFKLGVIMTQPSIPQALMEEDITVTDCVMIEISRRGLRISGDSGRRSLQIQVPRVLWRIDTFMEYFGYSNGTKYFNDFVQNFFAAVASGTFIGAMELADPSLVGISTGSSDTVFGPYAEQSQAKSNSVATVSKKYFWPILIASLFCCCFWLFLLCFLFIKRRKENDGNVAPEEKHETIVVRETTIIPGAQAESQKRSSSRHQVKISAVSLASPNNNVRGRVLTPGAAKSFKDFTGLPPYNASNRDHAEKLQTWIINLEQCNSSYREHLDLQARNDEDSLTSLLTLPNLTDDQVELLLDFAEELYSDCESLFGRLHGVVESHGSLKFGRIRQSKYTQMSESPLPSPPRPKSSTKVSNLL